MHFLSIEHDRTFQNYQDRGENNKDANLVRTVNVCRQPPDFWFPLCPGHPGASPNWGRGPWGDQTVVENYNKDYVLKKTITNNKKANSRDKKSTLKENNNDFIRTFYIPTPGFNKLTFQLKP